MPFARWNLPIFYWSELLIAIIIESVDKKNKNLKWSIKKYIRVFGFQGNTLWGPFLKTKNTINFTGWIGIHRRYHWTSHTSHKSWVTSRDLRLYIWDLGALCFWPQHQSLLTLPGSHTLLSNSELPFDFLLVSLTNLHPPGSPHRPGIERVGRLGSDFQSGVLVLILPLCHSGPGLLLASISPCVKWAEWFWRWLRALAALTSFSWTASLQKFRGDNKMTLWAGLSGFRRVGEKTLSFSLDRANWMGLCSYHHKTTDLQKNQNQCYLSSKLQWLHCINTLFFPQQELYFQLSLPILQQRVSAHLG